MKKKTSLPIPSYEIDDQIVTLTAYTKKGKPVTAIFDVEDLDKVQSIDNWIAQWHKDFNEFLIQSKQTINENGKTHIKKVSLPATILNVSTNAPIRHINGNLMDNRKSNLEIYVRAQKNDYQVLANNTVAVHLKNRYGQVVADALISQEDLERVVNPEFTWIQKKRSNGQPRVVAHTEAGFITLDRYLTECPENFYVYHINKNPLDNRRQNLELKKIEPHGNPLTTTASAKNSVTNHEL